MNHERTSDLLRFLKCTKNQINKTGGTKWNQSSRYTHDSFIKKKRYTRQDQLENKYYEDKHICLGEENSLPPGG
jgi:hypothetical protein